jgi:hypothetical protein
MSAEVIALERYKGDAWYFLVLEGRGRPLGGFGYGLTPSLEDVEDVAAIVANAVHTTLTHLKGRNPEMPGWFTLFLPREADPFLEALDSRPGGQDTLAERIASLLEKGELSPEALVEELKRLVTP